MDDPDSMLFMEEWSSCEEYEHHIKSDTFRIILSLIDLSDEAPLIKLNTISKTEGLETIEAVRIGQRIWKRDPPPSAKAGLFHGEHVDVGILSWMYRPQNINDLKCLDKN